LNQKFTNYNTDELQKLLLYRRTVFEIFMLFVPVHLDSFLYQQGFSPISLQCPFTKKAFPFDEKML